MFVLNELRKSVKFLEDVTKELEKIDNITDIDAYELKAQKIVFNLQMQANQVAGELVPFIMNRRTELQTANARDIIEKLRKKRQEIQEKISHDTNASSVPNVDGAEESTKVKEEVIEEQENVVPTNTHSSPTDNPIDFTSTELESDPEGVPGADGKTGKSVQEPVPDVPELALPENDVQMPVREEVREEEKVEDGRDSNRQRKPNTGNRKSKSSKKTK